VWANGGPPRLDDEGLNELVDAATADRIRNRQRAEPASHAVLPEHWAALELYLACTTQWRQAPLGGVIGLDYQALAAVMDMHQVPMPERKERLAEVQWIERGALEALKKKRR